MKIYPSCVVVSIYTKAEKKKYRECSLQCININYDTYRGLSTSFFTLSIFQVVNFTTRNSSDKTDKWFVYLRRIYDVIAANECIEIRAKCRCNVCNKSYESSECWKIFDIFSKSYPLLFYWSVNFLTRVTKRNNVILAEFFFFLRLF